MFTPWKSTFITWSGPGPAPNTWTSSEWESQVSGCQLAASKVVKAWRKPVHVSPASTRLFSYT